MKFGAIALAMDVVLIAIDAQAQPDRWQTATNISRDLGVATGTLVACFRSIRPALQLIEPGAKRQQASKTLLLPCLQQANPAITSELLSAVIDKYRPEGRVAG
jgi:hypothetical protein